MIDKPLRDQLRRDFRFYVQRNWRLAILYNCICYVCWQTGRKIQVWFAKESSSWQTPKIVTSLTLITLLIAWALRAQPDLPLH